MVVKGTEFVVLPKTPGCKTVDGIRLPLVNVRSRSVLDRNRRVRECGCRLGGHWRQLEVLYMVYSEEETVSVDEKIGVGVSRKWT